MPEDFEEKSSQGFDLQRWLGIARRRHLHFLIAMFLGWLVVWGASWVLPARYKSSTLILVEQPTMPKDYVTPNINDNLQERLQSITQQILSRTRLLHIIDQLNLYEGEHLKLTPDEKVEQMRKEIEIELVHDSQNRVTAFRVHYSTRDPHLAQRVTSKVTNLFINENLEVRQKQSEDTTKFLETQLETARQSLEAQEAKMREFKGHHVGELPTQLASNLQILGGLQTQLHAEEDALNTAKQQHVYLDTLLSQFRTLQGSSKISEGTQNGLPAIDHELDRLKSELASLSSRYTEHHPDLRKLQDRIAKMEKMREQLLAELESSRTNPQPDAKSAATGREGTDPTQVSPMAHLQSQLQANEVEIKNREQAVAALKSKVDEYQARLNQEPVREQQLADLARDYDQSKANYDELLKKKNESARATSMELLQQGERFRVIDPPSLPLKPEFPKRIKFCVIGLAIGLVLGAGVVGAFEMLDDRLYAEKELKALLPVSVIAEIPVIVSPSDERRTKKRIWLGWAATAAIVVTILAGSAISYFRG